LALVDIEQAWQSGMIFVLGAICALWSTRVMRLSVLVYVGLIQLAAGAIDLTWWITPVGHTEIRIGWVALAAAVLGLLLWARAAVRRRRGMSAFYTRPCFEGAIALTAVAFIVALDARFLGREAFRLGVLALATNAVVTLLMLVSRQHAALAYAAVFHVVAA